MNRKKKLRIGYTAAALCLLLIEIWIACFVHDRLIRPYIGDVLVVILLYTFLRIFIPEKGRFLPLWIFLFAVGVELLQYFRLAELPIVRESLFLRVTLGSVFDGRDIVCYGVGCLLTGAYEFFEKRKEKDGVDKNQ